MKKHELIFGFIRVPIEFLIIFVSFFIARQIRLGTDLIPNVQLQIQTISLEQLVFFAFFGSVIYVGILALQGMYQIDITSSKIKEVLDVAKNLAIAFFLYIGILYLAEGFLYEVPIPRLILFFSLLLSIIGVILARVFLNSLQNWGLKSGFFKPRRIILVMDEPIADINQDLEESIIYKVVGYLAPEKMKQVPFSHLGDLSDIKKVLKKRKINEVFFVGRSVDHIKMQHIFEIVRILGIRYKYLGNVFDISKQNTQVHLLGRTPLIEIQSMGLTHWGRIIKRAFDIVFSAIVLVLCAPFFLLIALAIKIEDPAGPVIFRNLRVGKNGRNFHVYKFRYMKWKYCTKEAYGVSAKNDEAMKMEKELIKKSSKRKGAIYKIENDPRKTKVGTFLEKWSIDELPQFFNALLGNMSVIGPRPHQPREVRKYDEHQRRVLTIKPGITGMAQVNGRESNSVDREIELDVFYIENWSLLLDLKIFFKTLQVILFRK